MTKRKPKIPEAAKCVVCGKGYPTDFAETCDGKTLYFHYKCAKDENVKQKK